jgi:hypothetical protein
MNARTLLASLTLGLASPALANEPIDGLAWQWNGASHTYAMETTLLMPEWVWLRALNNYEVRAMEIYMDLIVTCAPQKESKKRWFVTCTVLDIGMQASPMQRDEAIATGPDSQLAKILQEWKERLTGAEIEMAWTIDGKMSAFKWNNLDRRNRRDLENTEIFRQLFMRSFSPLQLKFPSKGTDEGTRKFEEKNPMLSGYPAGVGGVGSVRVAHTLRQGEGNTVSITSIGAGAIGHPTATATQVTQDVANTFDMTVQAEAIFDTAGGYMIRREATIEGIPSAGSAVSEGREALPYVQIYKVEHIAPGAEQPAVRETMPIKAKR